MPASCIVGTSASADARSLLETAKARSFPARICGTDVMTVSSRR